MVEERARFKHHSAAVCRGNSSANIVHANEQASWFFESVDIDLEVCQSNPEATVYLSLPWDVSEFCHGACRLWWAEEIDIGILDVVVGVLVESAVGCHEVNKGSKWSLIFKDSDWSLVIKETSIF